MRQRIIFILGVALVVGILIVLNSLGHEIESGFTDSEFAPDRSSYNAGPTGTQAFYELLGETGHRVMRWREQPARLLSGTGEKVSTFVVVGPGQIPMEDEGASTILRWVERGGTLVLIDRYPNTTLLSAFGLWSIATRPTSQHLDVDADVGAPKAVSPAKPSQPTMLTKDVEEVLPSRFATRIEVRSNRQYNPEAKSRPNSDDSPPPPEIIGIGDDIVSYGSPAPVAHINFGEGVLLADWARGNGRIVLLSDPYIVANNGISNSDNLQLALNLVTAYDGLVAIDEYHHGRGITQNAFVGYFSGTPVLPIIGQLVLLLLLVVYTHARRFARPIPWHEPDRRSSLEFVASMAELQHRARAFGLAVENIYGKIRRTLARNAGLEYNSPRSEIANRVAQRFSLDPQHLESVMRECEETINGEEIGERRALHLVRQLRVLEGQLKLQRR